MGEEHNIIKGLFVCNQCRQICHDGEDEYGKYGPNLCPETYPGRKTRIGCLGDLCDRPCELKKSGTDLTPEIAAPVLKYLVTETQQVFDGRKRIITSVQKMNILTN